MMMMMKLLFNNWPLKFSNCAHSVEIYLVWACTPGEEVFFLYKMKTAKCCCFIHEDKNRNINNETAKIKAT